MTCLCLTRNRREWLPKAIECYQKQTHPHRELLIISDGADVRDLLPDDPSIRLIHVEGNPEIGPKRNFGCDHATGEIIAHWDDDDYSAPGRLADQVHRLIESGKPVTGYGAMRFTDGKRWWQFTGTELFALGTSLCYRRDWWKVHRFPFAHVGEDGDFTGIARACDAITNADAKDLMYATIHPGNTSPRNLSDSWWKEI